MFDQFSRFYHLRVLIYAMLSLLSPAATGHAQENPFAFINVAREAELLSSISAMQAHSSRQFRRRGDPV